MGLLCRVMQVDLIAIFFSDHNPNFGPISSTHFSFYKQPVYKQRGLDSYFLSNWALIFSRNKQLQCMISLQIVFFGVILCIKTFKNNQQLSNFDPSNHPKFLSNWALTPESSYLQKSVYSSLSMIAKALLLINQHILIMQIFISRYNKNGCWCHQITLPK